MRTLIYFAILFFSAALADDWTTTDGKTYHDIKIVNQDAVFVTILDQDGGAKIAINDLSPEIQKKLNFDPVAAQAQIEATKKEQDETAARKAAVKILFDKQLTAYCTILQVVQGGIIAKLIGRTTQTRTYTTTSQVRTIANTGTVALGEGADVVNYETVSTDHNDPVTITEGRVFIACDTTGLIDGQLWQGTRTLRLL